MTSPFPLSLPPSLARDGWWLVAQRADAGTAAAAPPAARPLPPLFWAAAAMIPATDLLVVGQRAGLGWVIAAGIAVLLVMAQTRTKRAAPLAALTFVLGAAPFLETAGPFPTLFLILGTMGAVVILKTPDAGFRARVHNLARLFLSGPTRFLRSAAVWIGARYGRVAFGPFVVGWLAAVLLGLAFAALFALANPIIGTAAAHLFSAAFWQAFSPARLLFWAVVALTIGSCLAFKARPVAPPASPRLVPAPGWLAPQAIRNALLVFNVLFAAQTALDILFLWGGARLPDGMTYAQYAHRGAYPLLGTALLAGAFMFAATAFGPLTPTNRRLLTLWIVQNLALLASAILRLDLYVDAYQLTYLRLAAFIWMGLVSLGLALMLWRIWHGHSNRWLLHRLALATLATLYLCCFVNLAHVIATHNVTHSREATGTGQPLDRAYLCQLGNAALPAADAFKRLPGAQPLPCFGQNTQSGWRYTESPARRNWREWGFRHARLARYLAATQPPPTKVSTHVQDPHR